MKNFIFGLLARIVVLMTFSLLFSLWGFWVLRLFGLWVEFEQAFGVGLLVALVILDLMEVEDPPSSGLE